MPTDRTVRVCPGPARPEAFLCCRLLFFARAARACSMHSPPSRRRALFPMPLLRHSPALAPHRIPEQPFGHARDTVGFVGQVYALVYEWRNCDITVPATATSAVRWRWG